jgi:zinc protease
MNAVYGALTGSRLQRELREKRGLTYTSPSAFLRRPAPEPLVLYSQLPAIALDKTDSAVAVLLREFRGIAGDRPPTADEFDAARANRLASMPLQLETQEAVARQLAELLQQNIAPAFLSDVANRLATLTRDEALAAARRQIDPDHLAVVIAGNVAVLEPRLRKAALAPVFVVDATGKRLR